MGLIVGPLPPPGGGETPGSGCGSIGTTRTLPDELEVHATKPLPSAPAAMSGSKNHSCFARFAAAVNVAPLVSLTR
jgi:hypothetical protein